MNRGDHKFIWQAADWPNWQYDLPALMPLLADASRFQGLLLGRLADLGMSVRDEASLAALTEDVVRTSAIEGEVLDAATVRSSIARRLGVDAGALAPADRNVEGVVEMIMDATSRCTEPLTLARLCGWQAALFPTGYSGLTQVAIGRLRDDAAGPMQVVSGPVGRRRVHFEAPPAALLPAEVDRFLTWANESSDVPGLLKAGLAHLWFVTLHPFEDGNGRIARAVGDLFLARADGSPQRFYSLSARIQRERQDYYDILEQTQKGTMDVTRWLVWFLGVLVRALHEANKTLDTVQMKARFWQRWSGTALNERQIKVLNRMLDGFEGKLTSSKWAALAKCSPDTALRDITALLDKGMLCRAPGGGRSTAYVLSD
ncbi:MAG: Fic family protein [Candidatus Sericytochromatia bacterium]|nr:Fic family protein [Candidatus Sericytochromatia bacterium]